MQPTRTLLTALLLLAGTLLAADDPAAKIPVTTASTPAREEFLAGQKLVDNLRLTDAIPRFQKAIDLDPSFALAYLYLAQVAPTAKEFFSNLDLATKHAPSASKGERLWISGFRAGAFGDPATQRVAYGELVAAFPADERAQTLLGIAYFGQLDFATAASHLEKAVVINPAFAPAYNQLGYAYRFLRRFGDAERTFTKYIALIPDDPNPYDSYAEFLLKLGRFDEAIVQYEKALTINKHFANSYAGIAAALMYEGKHSEARAKLQVAHDIARNDGEKRAALLGIALAYVDEGKLGLAIREYERQYALGEAIHDAAAMAGDLTSIGNLLLEEQKPREAQAKFEKALTLITQSDLARAVKDNAMLFAHYNLARVLLAEGNSAGAEAEAGQFRQGAVEAKNANFVRLAHELAGSIALAKHDAKGALSELAQANQENPYDLYRLALAYQANGQKDEARKMCTAAAHYHALPFLNYAIVRLRAEEMLKMWDF